MGKKQKIKSKQKAERKEDDRSLFISLCFDLEGIKNWNLKFPLKHRQHIAWWFMTKLVPRLLYLLSACASPFFSICLCLFLDANCFKEKELCYVYLCSVLEKWILRKVKNQLPGILAQYLSHWLLEQQSRLSSLHRQKHNFWRAPFASCFFHSKSWRVCDSDKGLFLLPNCFLFGVWSPGSTLCLFLYKEFSK